MFQLSAVKQCVVHNMDDVVQEGRWRTIFVKESKTRHCALASRLNEMRLSAKSSNHTLWLADSKMLLKNDQCQHNVDIYRISISADVSSQ